jgi:hypothetical protein
MKLTELADKWEADALELEQSYDDTDLSPGSMVVTVGTSTIGTLRRCAADLRAALKEAQ